MRTDFVVLEFELSVEEPVDTAWSPTNEANLVALDDGWAARINIFCPDEEASVRVAGVDAAVTVTFCPSVLSFGNDDASDWTDVFAFSDNESTASPSNSLPLAALTLVVLWRRIKL